MGPVAASAKSTSAGALAALAARLPVGGYNSSSSKRPPSMFAGVLRREASTAARAFMCTEYESRRPVGRYGTSSSAGPPAAWAKPIGGNPKGLGRRRAKFQSTKVKKMTPQNMFTPKICSPPSCLTVFKGAPCWGIGCILSGADTAVARRGFKWGRCGCWLCLGKTNRGGHRGSGQKEGKVSN